MYLTPRTLALAAGVLATISVAAIAQQQIPPIPPDRPQSAPSSGVETLLVREGRIEWIERAAVASPREGIIEQIEQTIGMEPGQGDVIALLRNDMAQLNKKKAELAANDNSRIEEAQAKEELSLGNMARARRLNDLISREEMEIRQAELKVSAAQVGTAKADKMLAEQELKIAEQILEEHRIKAPFDGEVFEVLKHRGEAVQANEPVLYMVNTDRVRFYGYIPLQNAHQVRKGMIVDVTPVIDGVDLPVEKKRFRGRIVSIAPEVASGRRNEIQIRADIINNVDKELRPGLKADMKIYITEDESLIEAPPEDMLRQPAPTENPAVLGSAGGGQAAQ